MKNRLTKTRAPLSVNLEITDKCNLSCAFCFNAAPSYEKMMTEQKERSVLHSLPVIDAQGKVQRPASQSAQVEKILKIIDILAKSEVFELRLFGGEFSIFKPWREVVKYAYAKDFFISFVSNGYLLNNDTDVRLLVDNGVRDCTISLHGPQMVHDEITKSPGSFDRAVRSIRMLNEAGVIVSVAYTPVVENLAHLYGFVEMINKEVGVKYFSISRLFSDDRYQHLKLSDYHKLLKEIDRCHRDLEVSISLADSFPRCRVPLKYWQYLSYCSQGVGFAQVDFNGNLKHCSATSKLLGNLFDEDITQIWDVKLEKMRELDHLPTSCKICPIFCGGGCTVSRGIENQFAPDEFIPWPQDESWIRAVAKSLYNRGRKIVFQTLNRIRSNPPSQNEIPVYPRITQRYRIRKEFDDMHIAMFARSGVKTFSSAGAHVLSLIDGNHTVLDIKEKSQKNYPGCSEKDITAIIKGVI